MILEAILILLLTLAVVVIGFFTWYTRKLLNNLVFIVENIYELNEEVSLFKEHLSALYELEMFYGDETLAALLKHGQSLLESLGQYEYFYDLLESGKFAEIEEEPTENQENYEEADYDDDPSPEEPTQRKTVFYTGP